MSKFKLLRDASNIDPAQATEVRPRHNQTTRLDQKIANGPLKLYEAVDIAVQISEGLAKAHGKEIVHRDLKPANVVLTEDGVVKILDFGLAKLRGQTRLTKEGTTLGTAAYMSPEQGRGEEVDQRADIFSLGVLPYEMVTGQQPFKEDDLGRQVAAGHYFYQLKAGERESTKRMILLK